MDTIIIIGLIVGAVFFIAWIKSRNNVGKRSSRSSFFDDFGDWGDGDFGGGDGD
jgi:hypothetical protein